MASTFDMNRTPRSFPTLRFPATLAILAILGIWPSAGLLAQQVETFVSTDSLRVGDPFEVTLVVSSTPDYPELALPEVTYSGRILETGRQRFRTSTYRDSVILRLQYFAVGDTVLPGVDVRLYGGARDTTIRSSRVPLFFRSVLPDSADTTATGELRPIKDIYDFARPWWHYALAALLLAALIGGVVWGVRSAIKRRESQVQRTPREIPPFQNPLTELREILDGLSSQVPALRSEDFPGFYVELGNAIRRYMEDVYAITALEMTSFEIIRGLQAYHAHESLIRATRTVLREADRVKFARFNPTRDMARHAIDTSLEFLSVATREDRYRIDRLRERHLALHGEPSRPAVQNGDES